MNSQRCILLVLLVLAAIFLTRTGPAQAQTIWYVDAGAPGGGNGQSWQAAFNTLQAAIAAAQADQSPPQQIWARHGTYIPGTNRSDEFSMKSGVKVFGGLAGTEDPQNFDPASDPRDFVANETILSGEIGNPNTLEDNCYAIATFSGALATTRLDGFTITKASRHGVQVSGGSPTFQNLRIVGNQNNDEFLPYDDRDGAGMYLVNSAQPTLTDCAFESNEAES